MRISLVQLQVKLDFSEVFLRIFSKQKLRSEGEGEERFEKRL